MSAERAEDFDDAGVELVEATPDEVPAMASVYREEPVRWMRPPSDYAHAFNGFVMNRPALVFKVCEAGMMRGYMIVQQPRDGDDRIPVQEAAGDRRCLTGALGKLIRKLDLQALSLHVMGCDRWFQDCLQARGLTGAPANSSGTVTLINFVQFMERMRPYFAEVVGETEAQSLVFQEQGDEMIFTYGGDQVVAPDQGGGGAVDFRYAGWIRRGAPEIRRPGWRGSGGGVSDSGPVVRGELSITAMAAARHGRDSQSFPAPVEQDRGFLHEVFADSRGCRVVPDGDCRDAEAQLAASVGRWVRYGGSSTARCWGVNSSSTLSTPSGTCTLE